MAKRKAKNTKEEIASARKTRALKARHIAYICAEINSKRLPNGRLRRGELEKALKEHKPIIPWITIDLIKKGLKKDSGQTSITTAISDLTDSTGASSHDDISQTEIEPNNAPLPPVTIAAVGTTEAASTNASSRKVGRPRGTTVKATKERSLKEEALVNEITTEWAKVKQDERSTNHTLENLITKKKLEYCLEDVTVTKSCIRKRLTRKRLICARNPGSASPMKPVEEYLVSIFNQMAKMRQPLCISEGLALANSLVAGTKWEKEIFHFKTKRGWNQFDKEGNKKELLGNKWYKGFWKRNGHIIERKATQKFAKDRSEWSVYRNFVQMYEEVYDAMVEAGVAEKLEEPMWVDVNGNACDEEQAFGSRKATHTLTRPDMVLFVDEVGCNTSQVGDGHVGGQKKIVPRGTVPKESATTNDNHFTLLGFTAATGEPVMCAIIMEGKSINSDAVTGIDVFAQKVGNETDPDFVQNNTGPGKLYPLGPTCEFKGKQVPCVVAHTESGSITSELLASFLKHMDDLQLFPRDDPNVKPFLLLDGHGSRLELPFLSYVNNEEHPWVVCIGVPYGTSYWQVGDSTEQNGSYKMAITKAKTELVLKKQRCCWENARVETYEIVVVVNAAWEKSFARVEQNKKAIAARGWHPLTRNLLDHPEIAETKDNDQENQENAHQESSQDTIASTLNFGTGLANKVMVDILQNIDRDNVRAQIRSNQEQGQQALQNLQQCKKLSAGAVFKSGRAMLGPDVLRVAVQRKIKKDEAEQQKLVRMNAEKTKKRSAYLKTRAETTHLDQSLWSVSQLKSLISFKKRKTDTWQQPKTKAQLIDKWNELKNRETPPPSPAREEQDEEEEEVIVAVASV